MKPAHFRLSVSVLTLVLGARADLVAATIVSDHQPRAVIVVPAAVAKRGDPQARAVAESVAEASADLTNYIAQATGAKLPVVHENELASRPSEETRIFVGACEAAKAAVDFAKLQPEGFIIKVTGATVHIVGKDLTDAGLAVRGTANGCAAFLEKFLGVRWLMPGEIGEVVPTRASLVIADTELREEPALWQRKIRNSELHGHRDRIEALLQQWGVSVDKWHATFADEITEPWFRHQRLGSRVQIQYGHSYGGWYDKYHERYPDIFALQPDGTRNPGNVRETLCVSNPQLWDLVAQERIRELKASPLLLAASISPNDGSARAKHCSCERCRAWDSKQPQQITDDDPDAPSSGPQQVLTDRYFRYYNEVAKRVAREMPDRLLGCYAYSIYKRPPTELDHLEQNLLVGYVGFQMPAYLSDRIRASDRAEWTRWSQLAHQLFLRPNLFWGGKGLPLIYTHKFAEDLRFMYDSGMRATDYDGLVGNWGSEGLNYYVAARLLWDPHADVDAIIDDYCATAYGKGAAAMKKYFASAEALTTRIAREEKFSPTKNKGSELDGLLAYYTDDVLAGFKAATDQALSAIGDSDAKASARVKLVQEVFDYVRKVRTAVFAAVAVRKGALTPTEFKKVMDETTRYFASMAFSWSISAGHDFYYVRRSLGTR